MKGKSAKKIVRKEKSKNLLAESTCNGLKNTRSIGTFFKRTNVAKYEMTLKVTKDHLGRFPSPRTFPHTVRYVTKLLRVWRYTLFSLFFPLLSSSRPIFSRGQGNDKHSLSIRKFHICAQQQEESCKNCLRRNISKFDWFASMEIIEGEERNFVSKVWKDEGGKS